MAQSNCLRGCLCGHTGLARDERTRDTQPQQGGSFFLESGGQKKSSLPRLCDSELNRWICFFLGLFVLPLGRLYGRDDVTIIFLANARRLQP